MVVYVKLGKLKVIEFNVDLIKEDKVQLLDYWLIRQGLRRWGILLVLVGIILDMGDFMMGRLRMWGVLLLVWLRLLLFRVSRPNCKQEVMWLLILTSMSTKAISKPHAPAATDSKASANENSPFSSATYTAAYKWTQIKPQ